MKNIPLKLAAMALCAVFLVSHAIADDPDDQDMPSDDDAMVAEAMARLAQLQNTTQPTTRTTTQPTTEAQPKNSGSGR